MEAQPPFIDAASAESPSDDTEDGATPYPPREGCSVRPLIEAADMYPQLEELVLDAQVSVWLAFRIFDPQTPTRSERATASGLSNWAELLDHAARRGVLVRILLADFEPVLADYLHAGSWNTYRSIRAVLAELPEKQRDRLQLIVIQHEGEMGWVWRQLFRFGVRKRVRKTLKKLLGKEKHEDGGLETRPGLWPHVAWKDGRPTGWKPARAPHLWPATYHQKFVVIDGRCAVIGGLDLDERRWDDRRHRQRANQTWHDISALVEGPLVADAAHHFASLWNRELPRYRAIVGEWTDGCGHELMLDPLDEIGEAASSPGHSGNATVQLLRTVSRRSSSPFSIGPRRQIRELKAGYRSIMGTARRQLYIEAQFFRSLEAARWIESALRKHRELEVIILIANAPEEIAFEGQGENPAHRHGEYLQAKALGRLLRRAGPERLGLFTLAKREAVRGEERKFEESRGTAFGSGLIHIHSKLVIADDEACLLSSANINGRSFEWDTEAGILWQEQGEVAAFKQRLWAQLFGGEGPMALDGWRDAARHNATVEPEERRGFVLPYQLGRARRFARPSWFVPDDLV